MNRGKSAATPYDSPEIFEKSNRIKEAKRNRRQFVYAAMVVFLTFYVVLCLAVFLYYYISFNSDTGSTTLYSIRILNQKGKTLALSDAEQANKRFGFYISLTDLDKLCDLSVSGARDKLTLILRQSGEYLECFTNSSFLYVNGNPARLSIPVLYENREYYLPVELIEQYFIGVNIVYEKGVCKMSLAGDNPVLELKLKKQPISTPLPEP